MSTVLLKGKMSNGVEYEVHEAESFTNKSQIAILINEKIMHCFSGIHSL